MASEKKNPTKQQSNGKTRIDELRNAAFSFSICDHENDSSKITAVFEIDSKLYALTENYLWHIETPDGIDPERIHPEAKGATHKIFSTGSKNPTISRTLLQAKRLLDSILLKNKLSKQRILSVYFKFVSNIVFSYDIYDSLVSEFLSHAKMFSEIPKKNHKTKIIPSIPQIINLESRIQSFFSHCHKAIKHLVDLTRVFDSQISKSKNTIFHFDWIKNKSSNLYKMLQKDSEWVKYIWNIRNAIEHPNQNEFVEFQNIKLTPDFKFCPPAWCYKLPGNQHGENLDLLHGIESIMNDIISFGEEFFVFLCMEYWSDFPYVLYKIPDDQIDKQCIVQYAVTIDPSAYSRKSAPPTS